MSRRKKSRRIQAPPIIKGMSVYGVRGRKSNEIILRLEEFEAIRLLDYQNLTQEQAAVHMDISRRHLPGFMKKHAIKLPLHLWKDSI